MYKIHVLQHVPFEDIGCIKEILEESFSPFRLTYTRFYEATARLPDPGDFDLIIVMGGPMSVNDEDRFAYLRREKEFLQQAIEDPVTDKKGPSVLGICLGAQLIAAACGCEVYPNTEKEIGWFPVTSENQHIFPLPDSFTALHWHGDTFDLPSSATLLASSAACKNQAFVIFRDIKSTYSLKTAMDDPQIFRSDFRRSIIVGLQFHLETTEDSLSSIIENCKNDLRGAAEQRFVDDEWQMQKFFMEESDIQKENRNTMKNILARLLMI